VRHDPSPEELIVAGIDIGGTKIAAAAISAAGRVLSRAAIPTEAERGFDDGLRRITALVQRVLAEAQVDPVDPRAIGIGCAGPVDPIAGTIDNPYTLPTWDGVNIVEPLGAAFGVPVALENDADVAAMGEYWLGAGQGGRIVVMVTVGTGIGGGLIVDGHIYRGIDGAHPEIGHLALDPDGPPCYCGARGCWESIASGPAMVEAARAARLAMPRQGGAGLLTEDPGPGVRALVPLTGERVVALAREGDPIARSAVDRAAQMTARAVFSLINLYVPDVVVLGGGVMEAYDLFEPAIRVLIERDTMAPVDRIAIRKAALGGDAGLLGAARIALDL
jgi:glucokinase